MSQYYLSHLRELESEAIFVIREVVAQFERPALLFSGGKDSIVLAYLSRKAFAPARIPFPLVHIDTGHNFPETMEYRDWLIKELDVKLVVGSVQASIDSGRAREETGFNASRNALQTVTLLDTIEKNKYDAAMGGARRDEERRGRKKGFSLTVTNLDNGTQRTSVPNCGTFSMAANMLVSTSAYSRSPTGPRWTCGNTFMQKTFPYQSSTIRISAK